MSMKDVVRWLRDEHDNTHEIAARLRSTAVKPPRGNRSIWVEQLRSGFDDFAACVRQNISAEENGGYLQPILDIQPALAPQVDLLRHEHEELVHMIDNVQRAVHQLAPTDNLLLRDCCKRIESLLSWHERHAEHENHIVLYVLSKAAPEVARMTQPTRQHDTSDERLQAP
ncbi:MAG: hemerythrin domain-containing protein [Planctomycetes bacterium]|nr:hemerythrin domain-containing protein [Planctomycetota bacterium]